MNKIFKHLKGDRVIWGIIVVLGIFSFMPVYSASTNLVYVVRNGTTSGHLFKHGMLLTVGFFIVFVFHKIKYKYISTLINVIMLGVCALLLMTLFSGLVIGGANASRWIRIPFLGVGFQPSTIAGLAVMIFTAKYLAKIEGVTPTFKSSFISLWIPVGIVLMLIIPADFSTTAIIFMMVMLLTLIGGYPFKYLLKIAGMGIATLLLFVLLVKAFPSVMPNRVDTWMSRIESFLPNDEPEGYQVQKAKTAIAIGKLTGRGPGKSTQKNFLPQSSSDFIFAIIIEEYGLVGAFGVIFFYTVLLFRIVSVVKKASTVFAKLLAIAVGLPIIFQAVINMSVAVNLLPVTGQPLPLISSGGTSVWITCIGLGILLNISSNNDKVSSLEDNLEQNLI